MAIKLQRGVTLVELMFASAIIGFFILSLPTLFRNINTDLAAATNRIEADHQMVLINNHIEKFVRTARRSTVTLTQDPGENPYSKIVFTNTAGDTISIYQQGLNLIHEKNADRSIILKSGLQRLTFGYPNILDDRHLQYTVSTKSHRTKLKEKSNTLMNQSIFLEYQ